MSIKLWSKLTWCCRWGGIWYQGIFLASFPFGAYNINYIREQPRPSRIRSSFCSSVAFFWAYWMCQCVCDGSCYSIRNSYWCLLWGGSYFKVYFADTIVGCCFFSFFFLLHGSAVKVVQRHSYLLVLVLFFCFCFFVVFLFCDTVILCSLWVVYSLVLSVCTWVSSSAIQTCRLDFNSAVQ